MSDKREAEAAFFTPTRAMRKMREDAQTIEMLNTALLLLSLEFVRLARPQAIEAMEGLQLFRDRISKSPLTIAAEHECINMLDWALAFQAEDDEAAEEPAA